MAQQTPLGIIYPEAGDHTRLWEHLETLAESVETALAPRSFVKTFPGDTYIDGSTVFYHRIGNLCWCTGSIQFRGNWGSYLNQWRTITGVDSGFKPADTDMATIFQYTQAEQFGAAMMEPGQGLRLWLRQDPGTALLRFNTLTYRTTDT